MNLINLARICFYLNSNAFRKVRSMLQVAKSYIKLMRQGR